MSVAIRFFLLSLLLSTVFSFSAHHVYAARLSLTSPKVSSLDDSSIKVSVVLDPETDSIGSVSGTLSFPSELFDIRFISIKDTIVQSWEIAPSVSHHVFFNKRTKIMFKGSFSPGFTGVHSSFYEGGQPGLVMSVYLVPKKTGTSFFLLDNVDVKDISNQQRVVSTQTSINPFTIQEAKTGYVQSHIDTEIKNTTSQIELTKDVQSAYDAWRIYATDTSTEHAVDHFEFVETYIKDPHRVDSRYWSIQQSPYTLLYQRRDRYTHVKAVYSDGTYAYTTFEPVEKQKEYSLFLFILGGSAVLLPAFYKNKRKHVTHRKKVSYKK